MSLYNIVVLFAFGHWSMDRLFLDFDFEDRKRRVISHKTTCCFVENDGSLFINDGSFFLNRRVVLFCFCERGRTDSEIILNQSLDRYSAGEM